MKSKMAATTEEESVREELVFNQDFKEKLLFKLHELRNDNFLCDITLRIEGKDFAAHRCVLSAASPYFRSLFTSGFKENQDSVVELQEIKTTTMDQALRFIYTGEALINASNAQDLLRTADYLLIPSLKSTVSAYLKKAIDASNCLALESLAVEFSCESLQEAAVAFKLQNFVSVVKSDDFKTLDFERMKEMVTHDEIVVSKEEDVYEAVLSWVKHDVPSRESVFPELLKCLRLFSMSKYSLREILKEELIIKSRTCTSILHDGLDFYLFPDSFQGMSLKTRACLNTTEPVIILTGGHKSSATYRTSCFVLSKNQWASLPSMPCSRTRHGSAVCCGQLYVVGGKATMTMCCFDPKQNIWTSDNMVTMPKERVDCSVTALNEKLYVTGGKDNMKRVDKFDPHLHEWSEVASMKIGRYAHCAVVVGNLIYVLGGSDGEICHDSMECFDSSTNQWTDKMHMNAKRKYPSAATSCGKIFVVGGYGDSNFQTLEESCEVFDPTVSQWTLLSRPLMPRAASALVSFDHHLYLFGGEDNTNEQKLDTVECYDIKNDKWELIGTMPEKLACLQASMLLFPQKYIQ